MSLVVIRIRKMSDVENNKSFDFIKTWPEVLAKLNSVQDLLSVKMVVISKSPFDPKNGTSVPVI